MRVVGLLWMLLLSPLTAAGAEVVIETSALVPAELTLDSGDTVMFVNRSGHRVHIEFAPRPESNTRVQSL